MNNEKIYNFFHSFSCKHYCELASKNIDTELSTKESILLKLHHALCLFCRRYKSQIEMIEETCCSMAKNNELNPSSKLNGKLKDKLSDKCKEKIKESIS